MTKHPPGLIGLPCTDSLRTSDILPAIIGLQKPWGTDFHKANGLGPAAPLNEIGEVFLANPTYQWLFLTNDDNLCQPDALIKLLDRNVDVVSGFYLGKIQPFIPVLIDENHDRPAIGSYTKDFDTIAHCGEGCLLIRRHVLETIAYPWWEYGATRSDQCDHDLVLCKKIRAAGFKIWCDFTVYVDHTTQMVVRPFKNDQGAWEVHLCQNNRRIVLNV